MQFTQAVTRTPSPSLVHGLSDSKHLGAVDYDKALAQHRAYVDALQSLGLEVTVLPALDDFADACFVEDPAIMCQSFALLTRPGAPSRLGEVETIAETIERFFSKACHRISAPGTLEGGDVLCIDDHYYIGLSDRTNAEGAAQFIALLKSHGFQGSTVELHEMLHLKTGVSYLGNNTLLVAGEFTHHPSFRDFDKIVLEIEDAYAANAININGTVLMPSGFPKAVSAVEEAGFTVKTVDVSEFRKVDGGLSCLSLRF